MPRGGPRNDAAGRSPSKGDDARRQPKHHDGLRHRGRNGASQSTGRAASSAEILEPESSFTVGFQTGLFFGRVPSRAEPVPAMIRVGLAYDLRDYYRGLGYGEEATAEFDSPETVAALEGALERNGYRVERIGMVRELAERLVAGARWDIVFNVCEGLSGVAREAQVPALLEAYGVPYVFSDPLVMALTLHKAMAKHAVRDQGVPTAPFALVERLEDLDELALGFPLFAKPVAEGTGKGVTPASRVETRAELRKTVRDLIQRFRQPAIVEAYLPGREFTVGILGSGKSAAAIGVLEVRLSGLAEPGAYGYLNKEQCETRMEYRLVADEEAKEAERVALAAWRALGCRDGGRVDLRSDAGARPQFLEVNPLAGLHPTHSDLPILAAAAGLSYDELIGRIMKSALARIGLVRPGAARRRAAAE